MSRGIRPPARPPLIGIGLGLLVVLSPRRSAGPVADGRGRTDAFLEAAPSLIVHVNRCRAEPIPSDVKVQLFDYDWTVNARRRVGPG